jgi:hypothetical protein
LYDELRRTNNKEKVFLRLTKYWPQLSATGTDYESKRRVREEETTVQAKLNRYWKL